MLTPRKVKHRKHHRGVIRGRATQGEHVAFGSSGLQSLEASWITARQIESARRAMTRFVARGGKIWIRIFPDKAVTVKGNEIRMGGGKGAVDHFVAVVKPGAILFEMDGVTPEVAKQAMRLAAYKLPVKTRLVGRTR